MPFLRLCLIWVLPGVLAYAQKPPTSDTVVSNPQLASIVEQMQVARSRSKLEASYQVIREYRLSGEKGSNPSSEVWAKVDYLPPDHKTFVIQKRVGASRGEDVVRRILQHESQMVAGSGSQATLDNNNYSFGYLGEASIDGSPCYLLSLNPKRKEIDLIRGTAWVDEHSFLVRRVEGQMAKTPSWLLKKVDLKIDFAEMQGTWLQTGMEAVADVRLLGSQTLKSETVEVRIGSLLTQKTPPADRTGNGKTNRSRMPATMIVPLDHPQ
jgi:outer membrane lipoprotein-sorting protein